jgi:hypothetical protein
MRRTVTILLALLLLVLTTPLAALAQDVSVKGYFRKDGTYVQPHMRSRPDSSFNNNWSTAPNVNPYTGKQGTRQPRLYDGSGFGSSSGGYGSGFGTRSRSRSRY